MEFMDFILNQVQKVLFWTESWSAMGIIEAIKGIFQ